MARKKFTDEMKAAFMTAVHGYMAKGWSAGSAYKQVAAEYQQEGKDVPEKSHFYRWLEREKRETGGEREQSDGSDLSDGSDGAGTDEEARDPEDGAETEAEPEAEDTTEVAPELDDYTSRLEMMVRLYRTRSEAAVDAVCDRLLPELAEEE